MLSRTKGEGEIKDYVVIPHTDQSASSQEKH